MATRIKADREHFVTRTGIVLQRELQAARERISALEKALLGLYAERNNGRLADHLEEVCRKYLRV